MNERPYEPADLPSVIETYTASIRVLAAPYDTPEQIAAWAPIPSDAARWQEHLAHLHTIVAESDGLLAGFASYTLDGYLDFLFTHPAFARHGVASSLYHRVESAFRAVSTPKITTLASLAARPFFERHGFQLDSEECIECRGAYLRRFAMPSNSAMNESSNQSMQPTASVYVSFLCWPRGRLILCLLNGYALL